MKLYAKCVTPIHVGSGKVLEPFDYYFNNGKLIILNISECLSRLYEVHPEAVEKYSKWVNHVTNEITNAKRKVNEAKKNRDSKSRMQHNQIISQLRKEFNLIEFCQKELQDRALSEEFLNNERYHLRTMNTLDKPRGTFQVRELIQNGFKPYVPGSSIKGALRTALAYRTIKNLDGKWLDILLNGKPGSNIQGIGKILIRIKNIAKDTMIALEKGIPHLTKEALNKLRNEQRKWERKIGNEIEKIVFGCGMNTKIGIKYDDPKFDLLRLLKISDSIEKQFDLLGGYLMSFTYNRRMNKLTAQPVQFCELIDEDSIFSFDIFFELNLIDKLLKDHFNGLWIDFKDKFEQVFKISSYSDLKDLEEKMMTSIFDAMQEFSRAILEHEKDWFDQFSEDEVFQLEDYLTKLSSTGNFLRLGFSSGWHSTTVGLALANNPKLQDYLPEIIYAFNLDLIISQKILLSRFSPKDTVIKKQLSLLKRIVREKEFPKSRRLIAENQKPYAPLGWLQLKSTPFKQSNKNTSKITQVKNEMSNQGELSFEEKLKLLKNKFK